MEMSLLDYIHELKKKNEMMEEERSMERKRYEVELSADIKRFEEECSMYRKRYEEYLNYLKTIVFNLIQMNWTDEQIVNQLGLTQNWLDEIREELQLSLS